jgi:putative ABC transport system permease protein
MLKRKMFRDIKNNLSQFITIFLMVLIGVMAYTGIEAYMDGMKVTRDKYYSENNIQDLNLMGTNLTKEDLAQVKSIDNIKDAELKLNVTGITDNDKTLLINFIESNNISKFYVFEGIPFDKDKSGVWIDNFYAHENDINVGDTILVKYENLSLHEKVLGIVNIPDHLYDVRDESELNPDRKEFGIAYLSVNEISENYIKEKYLERNLEIPTDFNYKDYIPFNSIMVDLDDLTKIDITKEKIEDNVKSVLAIINIEDTDSYVAYQGEIDGGKTYVGVFSGLFLFIAMLSVITTMTRVVKNQRIQIGTLKALGFKDYRILFHYIGYGFWISLLASICGILLGYFLIGKIFISLVMDFFEIPNGKPNMNLTSYIVALLVILVVSIITYFTCKKILKENPAETLRNKIPNVKKNSLNITTKSLFKKLSFSSKWNLRDMIRNKMRTIMGIAGVVGCTMLIVCAFGMLDSSNYFIKLQFEKLYNFDYKLTLKEDISEENLRKLEEKYGSNTSKSLGIEIIVNGKRESNNIFVDDSKNYVRFVDNNGKYIKIDNDKGIYVTYKLAKINNYKLGDKIKWHVYGSDEYYESEIVGFNKDPQNQNITITRNYLESLGIKYSPDSIYTNEDLSNIKELNGVEVIQDIEALKDGMTNMLSMMRTMQVLIISIAILLGSIIIYNLGILSYTEKQYQFATLKVLGFRDKQIKKIFIKQNNWIAIISILIGLPLGFYLTDWLFKTAIEEHYDFGVSITIRTYIIASFGTFIISYIVSKFLARKVKDIDMVSSLKGNE